MKGWVRLVVAVVVGYAAEIVIAVAGLGAMRAGWPAYVPAEPTKAYTLPMMVTRLRATASDRHQTSARRDLAHTLAAQCVLGAQ